MSSREGSVAQSGYNEQTPDPKRGQQALDLLQDLQNPDNLKELKNMLGTRAFGDLLGLLKDIHKVHQNAIEQEQQLQDELRTLKIKYIDLKKHLTTPQNQTQAPTTTSRATEELNPSTREPALSIHGEQTQKKKIKMPDPPVFQNDGNPTWEDWYVDMKVKLRSETTWENDDKMGYVLSRTGKNARALIQTGYLEDEYSTAEEMLQVLANAYDDPHKKTKARAMYRNLRMQDQERFDTFMSKFTAYAAQAGITDNTTKREDLYEKVTKPLRDSMRPCLSLYPTFTDLREQLSLLYWELEAEKKRTLRTTQPSANKPASSARLTSPRTTTSTTIKEEKEKPTYSDKRKTELSAKGACFNCEQTGHMARDCPKKNVIKALEFNEESEKEDP
jgi:hypothetical protein